MRYVSTRGHGPVSFEQALLDGLAPDGGLYLPQSYPQFSQHDINGFVGKSYQEVAEAVMAPFVEGEISTTELRTMIDEAYATFSHDDITPVSELEPNLYLLELYHGPTLAFKDVALQLLGRLLARSLKAKSQKATILGATSGDTGPAALSGVAGLPNINAVILFPKGRTSEVQRRQMTTLAAKSNNIFPIAIEGTFDDCQDIVKELFMDATLKKEKGLTAVNSISWARLMPQMVYYFYAWSRLQEKVGNTPLSFAVPTGNFGDIFAGYLAMRCGLPMRKLVIATNTNDILARFIQNDDYSAREVVPTISPSMDIQVASNFERYVFEIFGRDAEKTNHVIQSFRENGQMTKLNEQQRQAVKTDFAAANCDERETLANIAYAHEYYDRVIDPHTATGTCAAKKLPALWPMVVLATAHPAKFPDAVKQGAGEMPKLPAHLSDLLEKEEKYETLPNDKERIKIYLESLV